MMHESSTDLLQTKKHARARELETSSSIISISSEDE